MQCACQLATMKGVFDSMLDSCQYGQIERKIRGRETKGVIGFSFHPVASTLATDATLRLTVFDSGTYHLTSDYCCSNWGRVNKEKRNWTQP